MSIPLSILPDEEVSRCIPADEEAGFGALSTPRGRLPLRALDVRAQLDGLLSQVSLAQTFVNPFDEPLEATYVFPLPDRAAVTRFRMEVGGRVVEGVLKERGSARREYEVALKAGHRAAIAEEERPGVFSLRVGNLMPGESAKVSLTLAGPLSYDGGEVTFRFPLVVAPRYIPGSPLPGPSVGDGTTPDTDAVPDASRISPPVLLPGYPNPVRLSLTVDVRRMGIPVSDFRSSLHAVVTETDGAGNYRVTLQPGERLNRDFILRYRVGERAVTSTLSLLPDADNSREGTFALFLVPPLGQAAPARPRDVVFVLDRSGSMGGWKMVAARRALARMVDTLTAQDRFTVYAFDDRLELPPGFDGLLPATDRNRFRAIEFLAQVDARGGTEMAQPLDQAVRQLQGERDRVLVLVTDGQVGNEDQILRSLGQRLEGIRIFTLGIDQAVNEAFLKRLAALGGGCCDVVESEDRLDEVMEKVQRRIGPPLLTGLRLEAVGVQIEPGSVMPARLPDLFAGTAVTVLGRYRGSAEGTLTLQGRDEAGRPWSQSVVGRRTENGALAQVWARGQVRALEDRWVIGAGDVTALEREILTLSLRFGVLCRFTAYVAVDRSESVNEGGQQHRIVQPVEAPAGWEMFGQVDRACPAMPAAAFIPADAQAHQVAEQIENKGELIGARAEKKTMLARQVLEELNAGGRVSNKTQLARDDAARVAEVTPSAPAAPQASAPPNPHPRLMAKMRSAVPPKARKGSSLLGKLFGGIFNSKQEKPSPSAPTAGGFLDLTAYRRRAQDLLKELQSAGSVRGEHRLRVLGIVAVRLAALIEDLKSIGAPADVLRPLEKLHAGLQQLLGSNQPSEAEAVRLCAECEATLRAFAGDAVGATVTSRRK